MISGKGYKTRLLNPHDEYWDRRLGVHTFGYRPETGSGDKPDWQLHYTPAAYSSIFHALKTAGLSEDDVFTDLGSGMGRVVFAASWLGASRSEGVEILPDLTEIAKANHQSSNLRERPIRFTCDNAKNVDLQETTVLFIFHSFGADTLQTVLAKLEQRHTKNLRIIYMNPVFNNILAQHAWLADCGTTSTPKRLISTTTNWDVAIWRADDPGGANKNRGHLHAV